MPRIEGIDVLIKKLTRLEKAPKLLQAEMAKIAKDWRDTMKKYPPELANQKYVRTGKLGKSWKFKAKATNTGAFVRIFSDKNVAQVRGRYYTNWVQNRDTQARIHKGRWNTLQAEKEKREETIDNEIKRAVDAILSR